MRCVELRAGREPALFVFPGAGGEAEELGALASSLDTDRRVVGVEPFEPLVEGDDLPSVERLAELAIGLIKSLQPDGPYTLLGYSFGGLIALEVSQSLRRNGDVVQLTVLVDVIFDRRHWPLRLFASATARRSVHHLRGILRGPPGRAWPELVHRARRLAGHVADRGDDAGVAGAPVANRQDANYDAMARWRPHSIDGRVVLFTSGGRDDFGCDPASLWRPWIADLDVRRVSGSHLRMMRDAGSVAALAAAVAAALDEDASRALRVLIATTFPWESACRLAVELVRVGCVVEAVAPSNSPVHRLPQVSRTHKFDRARPLRALRRAIVESRADLVVPFDDRTRHALHQIHERADSGTASGARLREVVERSLGPPETYSWIYSRATVMGIAAEAGIRCPPTAVMSNANAVATWMHAHPGSAVLKTDGSWGGREVAVVHDADEAVGAWHRLSRPPGWARGAKRLLVDRDPWPLRSRLARRRPVVSVQAYVDGSPANVAAACLDGELLGAVQANVVRSDGPLGPSTVIRVTDDVEMLTAAREMAKRLDLTGLCGFDFVLEESSGLAYLVEVNPRATPTVHLLTAEGSDPLTSWRAALGHTGPSARTGSYPGGLVALYPQELQRDPQSPFLDDAYHDVPQDCPELVGRVERRASRSGSRPALREAGSLLVASGCLVVSACLFTAEAFVESHGMLAVAGAVAFTAGAVMLLDPARRPVSRRGGRPGT